MRRLPRSFYAERSLTVARQILGKYIIRKIGKRTLIGKIVEVEAYPGPYDKASHAFNWKRTKRNEAEWLEGGHVYIYLVYGMYWQLNISTGKAGYPECILIRAIEPIARINLKDKKSKIKMNVANGPGKLCRWLKLDKSFYGEDLTRSKRLWVAALSERERRQKKRTLKIKRGPRIGIDYAGLYWASKPWRFSLERTVL